MRELGILSSMAGRAAVVVATVAALGLGAWPAAQASTLWATVTSPNAGAANGNLTGVACRSLASCEAVGSDTAAGGAVQDLIESWNGTAWAKQTAPKPPGAIAASLTAVSCPAAGACEAVGSYRTAAGTFTQAEAWNGTSWTVQATPNPAGAVSATLTGVSCTSASACEAVGSSAGSGQPTLTLAEVWNGTAWTLQSTPNQAGASTSLLSGVSCTASGCVAVGNYYDSSDFSYGTLSEIWNGTAWTLASTPNPAGSSYAVLSGVSCTSAGCTAVGNYDTSSDVDSTLAETWNGTAWAIETTPNPSGAGYSVLTGVSCTSGTACTGAGYYDNASGAVLTLAETWNGTAWSVQTTPNPSGPATSELNAVACASGGCAAVGYSQTDQQTPTPVDTALAESWNGTSWTLRNAVSPSGAVPTYLASVSCAAANFCVAVGYHFDVATGYYDPLAEQWNGTAWTVKTVPVPSGSTGTDLESVSCASASSCEAVGLENTSGPGVTFAAGWNGTSWSIQTTPNPSGAAASLLFGVSCPSATACTAVGRYGSGGGSDTLAETWNGTAWTIAATPNPAGTTFATLNGVSCASGGSCDAVGVYNHDNVNKTFAEQWNGTGWTVFTAPDPAGAESSSLSSVSCPAAAACVAAGSYENSSGVNETLAEVWNGTAWKVSRPVNPASSYATLLSGVSCTGAGACAADGYYLATGGGSRTLAEVWNGTVWKTQSTATPAGAPTVSLQEVSCLASGCVAAGNFKNTGSEASLIEDGPTP